MQLRNFAVPEKATRRLDSFGKFRCELKLKGFQVAYNYLIVDYNLYAAMMKITKRGRIRIGSLKCSLISSES